MASLGRGHDSSGERALVQRGVGLEAITIEQGPALAKLPLLVAVQIPRGMLARFPCHSYDSSLVSHRPGICSLDTNDSSDGQGFCLYSL